MVSNTIPDGGRGGLRVALLNYEYPPGCGGGGVFTANLCAELEARGHSVRVITGGAESVESSNGATDLAAYPFRAARELVGLLHDDEIDVVNAHFSVPTALLLPLIQRYYAVPYVVNVMGADLYDPTRFTALRPLLTAVNKRWVLRHANHIIVPSRDMAQRLPAEIKPKSSIVPYFVDTKRFSPRPPTGENQNPDSDPDSDPGLNESPADASTRSNGTRVSDSDSDPHMAGDRSAALNDPPSLTTPIRLLTVARLVDRKHIELALKALDILRVHSPGGRYGPSLNVHYTLAGNGEKRAELEMKVQQWGLSEFVDFRGYVPDDDLPGLYRAHDVFLLPSRHEAFGIAGVEALASGLPLVTTTTGGHAELATDECGVSTRPDPRTFAAGIRTVVRNYSRMATAARERAETRFRPDVVVQQYESIYRQALESYPSDLSRWHPEV